MGKWPAALIQLSQALQRSAEAFENQGQISHRISEPADNAARQG